jgi:hypothetical protein
VALPRGIPHGFMVQTPVARILHAYTPAGLEDAFRALSTPALGRSPLPDRPPDPEVLARMPEVYGAHGVTFVGPPLSVVLAQEATAACDDARCGADGILDEREGQASGR